MIQGQVTREREAIIRISVLGPSRQSIELEAVVDTGFTDFLTLEAEIIRVLELEYRETMEFELADGNVVELRMFRAVVEWHGVHRGIVVAEAEGGALAGMALLYGNRVTLEIIDGGLVSTEAL